MNMESLESMQFFPKLIANTTVGLTPKFFDNVYKQQITLPDVTYTLKPGDSLLFSIEIIPSNKTLPTLITKYVDVDRVLTRWEKRANWLENRSNLKKLQTFGTTLKDIISIIKEGLINITSDDFAAIINAMRSSSFVYDSVQHPSSVSIPALISVEDIRIYFLGPNREMITTQNDGANSSKTKILTTPTIWTANQCLERNKILKIQDITAELYFSRFLCLLPRKVSVTVTLYDDNTTIASSQKQLTKNELQ